MSTKSVTHSTEDTDPNRRRRFALFGISIISLMILAGSFITLQLGNSQARPENNDPPIVYNDALAMHYAQPWLDKQTVQPASKPVYSDALAMLYARPWLDKQLTETSMTNTYNDSLALLYAQPWLSKQNNPICNGRLDIMYACANGYQP